jgi:hypothetical protein
MVVEDWKNA